MTTHHTCFYPPCICSVQISKPVYKSSQSVLDHHSNNMAYSEDVTEGYNAKIVSREGSDNFNYVEAPNASRMLGNIEGLRVVDLACGSGRFTRWLKTSKHAADVVGVDMSEDMIEHAREIEKKEPLDIHYHVADVSKPLDKDLGTFDVCFAGYLLHYARDKDMLKSFGKHLWLVEKRRYFRNPEPKPR